MKPMAMVDFWMKNIALVKHDQATVKRIIDSSLDEKQKEEALRDYCLRCEEADQLAFDAEWRSRFMRKYGVDPMKETV